jgi:hypothetical protein
VHLRPIALGVGRGQIVGNVILMPRDSDSVPAQANLRFQRLDLFRTVQVTRSFEGASTLSGRMRIEGAGYFCAAILGAENGTLALRRCWLR